MFSVNDYCYKLLLHKTFSLLKNLNIFYSKSKSSLCLLQYFIVIVNSLLQMKVEQTECFENSKFISK